MINENKNIQITVAVLLFIMAILLSDKAYGQIYLGNPASLSPRNLSELKAKYLYNTAKDTTDVSVKTEELITLDLNPHSLVYYSTSFLNFKNTP